MEIAKKLRNFKIAAVIAAGLMAIMAVGFVSANSSGPPGHYRGWVAAVDANGRYTSMNKAATLEIIAPNVEFDSLHVYFGAPVGKTYWANQPDSPEIEDYAIPPRPQLPEPPLVNGVPQDNDPDYLAAYARYQQESAVWEAHPEVVRYNNDRDAHNEGYHCANALNGTWTVYSDNITPAPGEAFTVNTPAANNSEAAGCIAGVSMIAERDGDVVALLNMAMATGGKNHMDGGSWFVQRMGGMIATDEAGHPQFEQALVTEEVTGIQETFIGWQPELPDWILAYPQSVIDQYFPCSMANAVDIRDGETPLSNIKFSSQYKDASSYHQQVPQFQGDMVGARHVCTVDIDEVVVTPAEYGNDYFRPVPAHEGVRISPRSWEAAE